MRLARRYVELDWRSASRTLLSLDESYLLDGDFRGKVWVEGLGGWQAELMSMCWFGDEFYRYREAIKYLIEQPDDDLARLHESLSDGLSGNDGLCLMADFVESLGDDQPLATVCGGHDLISASLLLSLVSREDLIRGQQDVDATAVRKGKLTPFEAPIQNLIASITADWAKPSGYASGIGYSMRKGRLTARITDFVLILGRLPLGDELAGIVEATKP